MEDLENHLRDQLERAASNDLLRVPSSYETCGPLVATPLGSWTSFASNDYLGLAAHPKLRAALAEGAQQRAGAGSSPIVAGSSPAHRAAEAALAEFVRLPATRLFSSAYAANLGVLAQIFSRGDLLVCDAHNHASLIDGCRLSRAQIVVYDHGDIGQLRTILRRHRPAARLAAVVTETAFSMDGDVADVATLRSISAEFQCALIVDEAHALGIIGPQGRGVCAATAVVPDILVGGLGKSFGLGGGFAAGSLSFGHTLDNFARTLVFSTAVLPALAHAVPTAVDLISAADDARLVVHRHATALRTHCSAIGLPIIGHDPGVIVPVIVGSALATIQVAQNLRARGFLVPYMRPPTVAPGTSRLRITPTALHTDAQVARLCTELERGFVSPGEGDHRDESDHP